MCSHENSFQPAQFLLLVGVPVASALLLVQCLRWHCPHGLLRACWKPESQEEPVSDPTPLPEDAPPPQCPPAMLSEMAAFYHELLTPTQGRTVVRLLMHKLLMFSAREVDHRGGCLILQDAGISLLIPPGNSARPTSPRAGQIARCAGHRAEGSSIHGQLPDFDNCLHSWYDFMDSKDGILAGGSKVPCSNGQYVMPTLQ